MRQEIVRRAVVLGAGGFVGTAVCAELRAQGWAVASYPAPRLASSAQTVRELATFSAGRVEVIGALASAFDGANAVVNAAGAADPSGRNVDDLFGANALLPYLVAAACRRADIGRLVHISSAAVQGDLATLDEEDRYRAVSAYARSKSLGEQGLLSFSDVAFTILRPTSVHGRQRLLTRRLAGFAASPLSSVARPGTAPTPQVLVGNVGGAAAYLCHARAQPPPIVLQPWEGWSTAGFLQCLSGKRPVELPRAIARVASTGTSAVSKVAPMFSSYQRRLDLLWYGQSQVPGWLKRDGFIAPEGLAAWDHLAWSLRKERDTVPR